MTRHTLMPLWATIRGGKTWIEKNALLYDTFKTADAAPITSPRTCEPGPGTLTLNDSNNYASLSGGELVCSDVTNDYNPGLYMATGSGATRDVGLALFVNGYNVTGKSSPRQLIGISSGACPNSVNNSVRQIATNFDFVPESSVVGPDLAASYGTSYCRGIVTRPVGVFMIVDGVLQWADNAQSIDTTYFNIGFDGDGENCRIEDVMGFDVSTYDSSWGGDWTEVTDTKTNPASATTFNCNADFHINYSLTVEDGKYVRIYFRIKTANQDELYLDLTTGRTLLLRKIVGGDYSTMATLGILSDATSYEIDVTGVGSTIKVFINKVLATTQTVTDHQTETGGRVVHTLASNDIVLATHPHPSLGIADSRVICPQATDTALMSSDAVVEIKNIQLPSSGDDQIKFRHTDSNNSERLYIRSDGQLDLYSIEGGSGSYTINTGAGTVSDGDDIVVVFDGSTAQIFVNGSSVGSTAASLNVSRTGVTFNSYGDDSTCDHVAFFPRDVSSLLPKGTY